MTGPSSNPRPRVDQLTDDMLDQLYARLEQAEAERDTFREVARSNHAHVRIILPELEEAQAAIARVRAELANPLLHTRDPERQGERWLAARIRAALDGTT